MMSTIPVAGTVSIIKTNEDSKERILFTLQIAVKQIQHYASLQSEDEGLSAEVHEVKQLCENLDKALFHGLKCFDRGYWAFVKEFTHSNTIKFLEKLENVHTELQCGRAWLCLALNEANLESYFRSFMQNSQLVRKYYDSPALLYDEQRMQLVLMLMAGLEFVPINLNVGKIGYGSGVSFFETHSIKSCVQESQYSSEKISDTCASIVNSELPFDSAVEVTSDFTDISPSECQNCISNATEILHKDTTSDVILKTVSQQDLERISHYINIDTENNLKVNEDLEVIRTKVVRRAKKSCQKSVSNEKIDQVCSKVTVTDSKAQSLNESNTSLENRLSKATTDSGLCLETPYSSDSELTDLTDDNGGSEDCRQTSFEVAEFCHDLNVTFSTPPRSNKELSKVCDSKLDNNKSSFEERGNPEGQEDPVKNICIRSTDCFPLLHSNGGVEDESEEEISIYDMAKISYSNSDTNNIPVEDKTSKCCLKSEKMSEKGEFNKKLEAVDIVTEELAKLAAEAKSDEMDLRVGHNIDLYFIVEVYEHEEENFYKLYCGYSHFAEGLHQRVYFLLSNKSVYFLKPGDSQQKFFKCGGLRYSSIDYIMVDLNYQGFKIVSRSKEHLSLYTADEELTRNILSNLEIGIRKFIPKLPLPSVYTDASAQKIILQKFVASVLNCEKSEVDFNHFVLAKWEDYTSSTITPSGPIYQDYLMYRHKFAKENKATPWKPAFFLLKGGVLYCMEDEKSKPLFFIQMCAPHCKGCRRIHLLNRPHTFEIIRENSDSLQLAAADTYEASKWLQCFLETVSLAGHFIDTERNIQRPCCVLFANDKILIAIEEFRKSSFKLLGKANLCDLVTVFVDPVASNFILLEFEIAEASKSSGEWIIYFESVLEKDKFLEIISCRWSQIFQVSLNVEKIKEVYLFKKCRQISEELKAEKAILQQFCVDD